MKEMTKTLVFCGAAVVAVVSAALTRQAFEPAPLEGYENVGEPFFEDFKDPLAAQGMRIAVYNPESAEVKLFDVENKNGMWTIPSHHNYPADGKDRLAKTAASVIGINRGALESRRKTDHERLGVIDPLDETSTALKGRGQRITIKGPNDTVLADYVIGSAVEGRPDEYFVRRADEDAVYRTKLSINLSTKFSDWIEADLLQIERDTLKDIVIRKYSIDEGQMKLVGMDVSELDREKPGDPWKLDGLDEAAEEVNTEAVNSLVGILDDLRIVGVRPKPAGLSRNLKIAEDLKLDPVSMLDLRSKGFIVARDQDGNQLFVANEGELLAATNQGVRYHLYFGEVSTGSELEIEIGKKATAESTDQDAKSASDSGDETAGPPENKDDATTDDKSTNDEEKNNAQNRFLFVTVEFDEAFIGPTPQEPTKPVKPEAEATESKDDADSEKEKDQAEGDEKKEESKDDTEDSKSEENTTEEKESTSDAEPQDGSEEKRSTDSTTDEPADEKNSDEEKTTDDSSEAKSDSAASDDTASDDSEEGDPQKEETEKKDPEAEYQAALKAYELALAKYKTDLEQHQEKVKQGKNRVKELNDRFADWYYVISGSSFEKLQLNRTGFVKAKEAPADMEGTENPEDESEPTSDESPADESSDTPSSDDDPASEPSTDDDKDSEGVEARKPKTDAEKEESPDAEKPDSEKASSEKASDEPNKE